MNTKTYPTSGSDDAEIHQLTIQTVTLDACRSSTGLVVVIDVLRAFTTAAYAFHYGAAEILLVSTVDEALELRKRFPGSLCMGEVNGLRPPGFDFGNSPSSLEGKDIAGRRMIQRTSAGTQGVVLSEHASSLLAASFVVAGATARWILGLKFEKVTFVITGLHETRDGDEDIACADYLAALLRGERPEPTPYLNRVKASDSGLLFRGGPNQDFSTQDLEDATALDRFEFALKIERKDGLLVMQPVRATA